MVSLRHDGNYIILEDKDEKKKMLMAYKSPLASMEQDLWLAWRLKCLYASYYRKVCLNNCLRFFGK